VIAANAGSLFTRRIRSQYVVQTLLDMKDHPDSHDWGAETVQEAINLEVTNEVFNIWLGYSA
jgi:hypothetical protein